MIVEQEYELAPLSALTPHPDNPRHGQVEVIAESVDANGFYGAIVAQRSTGHVLAGNHRLLAARDRGLDRVPVVWVDVDDERARRILLVDNRSNDLATYDGDALAGLLGDLPDLTGTGYAAEDLRAFGVAAPAGEEGGEAPADLLELDEVPEPPPDPVSRLGAVWLLGPHRLLVGDCTDEAIAEKLTLPRVDLILTDPPYCSGGFQEAGRSAGSVGTTSVHKQIANDRLSTRGYIALLKSALNRVPADFVYVFTDWRMWVNLFDVAESAGFGVRSMIVWDKGTPGTGRGWRSQHELILWGCRVTPPFEASAAGNVLQSSRTGNPLHTTQKPVTLLADLLRNTPFAGTVYDPFAGSGSTLIACYETGRTAYLAELDPAYADVICRRWQEHTGVLPIREATGEAHDFVKGA